MDKELESALEELKKINHSILKICPNPRCPCCDQDTKKTVFGAIA
jgi:hypothetical protein